MPSGPEGNVCKVGKMEGLALPLVAAAGRDRAGLGACECEEGSEDLSSRTLHCHCNLRSWPEEIIQPEPVMSRPTDTSFWGLSRRSSCQIPALLNLVGIVKCPFLETAKSLGLWRSCSSSDHDTQESLAGPVLLWAGGRRAGKCCSHMLKLIHLVAGLALLGPEWEATVETEATLR